MSPPVSTRAAGNAALDLLTLVRMIADDGAKSLLVKFTEERDELEKLRAEIAEREKAVAARETEHAAIAADHAARERDLSRLEQEHAKKAKTLDDRLASAAAVQRRIEEVERREGALGARSDSLDTREADIAAAHARRSAELDDREKALNDRKAKLDARAAAVAKAMAAE